MVKNPTKNGTKLPLGLSSLQTERIWGVVCFGRYFFFLAKVPVPSTGKLGIWKLKKGGMKGGCVGRIWFRLVS